MSEVSAAPNIHSSESSKIIHPHNCFIVILKYFFGMHANKFGLEKRNELQCFVCLFTCVDKYCLLFEKIDAFQWRLVTISLHQHLLPVRSHKGPFWVQSYFHCICSLWELFLRSMVFLTICMLTTLKPTCRWNLVVRIPMPYSVSGGSKAADGWKPCSTEWKQNINYYLWLCSL